jgi:hypothetical protein
MLPDPGTRPTHATRPATHDSPAGLTDDAGMLLQTRPSPIPRLAALVLCATAALGACSSGDDDSADTTSPTSEATSEGGTEAEGDGDVTDALESAAPTGTIEVPSSDGATTIAEYAAGGSSYEPVNASELATILAIIGTDADGYLTEDTVVVRTTVSDSTLLCGTVERLSVSDYSVIPVGPDGVGIACD